MLHQRPVALSEDLLETQPQFIKQMGRRGLPALLIPATATAKLEPKKMSASDQTAQAIPVRENRLQRRFDLDPRYLASLHRQGMAQLNDRICAYCSGPMKS